jgi:ubiquinol-cytochrome c reductase cytochrome b subunit
VSFVVLGYLGLKPPSPTYMLAAQICAAVYFAFFVLMPWYTRWDKPRAVPDRVRFHD